MVSLSCSIHKSFLKPIYSAHILPKTVANLMQPTYNLSCTVNLNSQLHLQYAQLTHTVACGSFRKTLCSVYKSLPLYTYTVGILIGDLLHFRQGVFSYQVV